MENALPQRIRKIISVKGMSLKQVSDACGIKQNTFSRQLSGENSLSSSTVLSIIGYFPDVNVDWLMTGNGEMLKSDKPSAVVNYEHRGAPYYDVDFIGGFDLVMNDQTANPDYYIDFPPYNKKGVVWCNVTGHSMEPEIYHGDMIALKDTNETDPNYLPFGEVYALVTDNYRTIKRLTKSDKEGCIRLVPTNPAPEYAPQDIPVKYIRKIYQVLVSVKRF